MILSDKFKFVLMVPPSADYASGDVTSDVVNMENFDHATIVIATGASSDNENVITVNAATDAAGLTKTAIPFKYRSVTTGDTYGDLTDATATGFACTASSANQYHILEIDAKQMETTAAGYEYLSVTVTEAGSETAQLGCVIGILGPCAYQYANLPTALT